MAILLLLASCTTGQQAQQLREGMSPAEVEAVLGRPDGFERAGDFVGYQYTDRLISGWSWDRADYYAIFVKERLVRWGAGHVRQGTGPEFGTLVVIPLQS